MADALRDACGGGRAFDIDKLGALLASRYGQCKGEKALASLLADADMTH